MSKGGVEQGWDVRRDIVSLYDFMLTTGPMESIHSVKQKKEDHTGLE